MPAHVNNNRADQNIAVAQEEIRRAARNRRTAIAAVDREIPRAAPALDEGDGEPVGVDSDGDVVVSIPPHDDGDDADDVQMQMQMRPDEVDEMPAADNDLHPDTVLDEANNAAQLAAIDAATNNHLHLENA